ncbi:hypothetical protein PVAP13_9NG148373 [Panicum virgatum]|uniref:Uncharacterized protein n=1 Tax=Panicum virgatum TaxID=38727 RepID=A0A8T0MKG4_PANVG|nr:hypothetical protein PVAP13_9NG148373 [Panicum virgatum]
MRYLPSTSDPAVPPVLARSSSSPVGCLFLAAPVPCGWLILLLAPSLPRWNTGHIRDAGPRPNMRTRTPHFFTANTAPFGGTPRVLARGRTVGGGVPPGRAVGGGDRTGWIIHRSQTVLEFIEEAWSQVNSAYLIWKKIVWVCCPVCYLKLAWSSILLMRLGCFGFAMEAKKDLKLEKGTQTKENLMGRLAPADMFVQMRVIERR